MFTEGTLPNVLNLVFPCCSELILGTEEREKGTPEICPITPQPLYPRQREYGITAEVGPIGDPTDYSNGRWNFSLDKDNLIGIPFPIQLSE